MVARLHQLLEGSFRVSQIGMSGFALYLGWFPTFGETTALGSKQTGICSQNQQKHNPRHRDAADDIRHWRGELAQETLRTEISTPVYRIVTSLMVNTICEKMATSGSFSSQLAPRLLCQSVTSDSSPAFRRARSRRCSSAAHQLRRPRGRPDCRLRNLPQLQLRLLGSTGGIRCCSRKRRAV